MNRRIIAAFCVCIFLNLVSYAQEQDPSETKAVSETVEFTFFNHDASTLVPQPQKQAPNDREKTLKQEIKSAIKILEAKDIRAFVQTFLDPYVIAEQTVQEQHDRKIEDFLPKVLDRLGVDEELGDMLDQLSEQLELETQWMLGGRVAWFGPDHNLSVWVYREGRWYYSPLFGFGSGTEKEDDTRPPIDFFAKSELLEIIDFAKLDSQEARLKSLRVAQQTALDLVDTRSMDKLSQFVLCPVNFAKEAVSSQRTIKMLTDVFSFLPEERMARVYDALRTELKAELNGEPAWLLDGRLAAYKKSTSVGISNTVLWEFYEGRWRLVLE